MKRIIILGLAMMIAIVASAQKNVTQFLGIPVDGTKTAMIQKLKDKGFTYNAKYECLEGEFNGRNVVLAIATNNNKVWRIMIKDASPSTETNIKIMPLRTFPAAFFISKDNFISSSFQDIPSRLLRGP